MNQQRNPNWWNKDYDSAWDRLKAAFKRDWDQTKHDFGGVHAHRQSGVDDAMMLAAGKDPGLPQRELTYEELEDAYRFGYGARAHYGSRYSHWDSNLEEVLERDWLDTYNDLDWLNYRGEIRRGWDYDERRGMQRAA